MRLLDLLVEDRLLDPRAPGELSACRATFGGAIDTNILENGLLDERALQPYLERTYSIKNRVDVWADAAPDAVRLLKREQAEAYRIVPHRLNMRALDVITADPTDLRSLDEVAFITGCRVHVNVASEARLHWHLSRAYGLSLPDRMMHILNGRITVRPQIEKFLGPGAALSPPTPLPTASPSSDSMPGIEILQGLEQLEQAQLASLGPPPPRSATSSQPIPIVHVPSAAEFVREATDPGARARGTPAPQPPVEAPPRPVDVRRSYEQIAAQLLTVRDRTQMAPIALNYLAAVLERVVLFGVNEGTMHGWDARGPRLRREAVEYLHFSLAPPSIFQRTLSTGLLFAGQLPQDDVEEDVMIRLGGHAWPEHVLIMPIRAGTQAMGLLYGEATTAELLEAAKEPFAVLADLMGRTMARIAGLPRAST